MKTNNFENNTNNSFTCNYPTHLPTNAPLDSATHEVGLNLWGCVE